MISVLYACRGQQGTHHFEVLHKRLRAASALQMLNDSIDQHLLLQTHEFQHLVRRPVLDILVNVLLRQMLPGDGSLPEPLFVVGNVSRKLALRILNFLLRKIGTHSSVEVDRDERALAAASLVCDFFVFEEVLDIGGSAAGGSSRLELLGCGAERDLEVLRLAMLAGAFEFVGLLVEEGIGLAAGLVTLLLLRSQLALFLCSVLGILPDFTLADLLTLAHVLSAVAVVEVAPTRRLVVVVEILELLRLRVPGCLLLSFLVLHAVARALQRRNTSALMLEPFRQLSLVLVFVLFIPLLLASVLDLRIAG